MRKVSEHGHWEITDISPSKLKKWMTCPKQFEYQYIIKPPSYSGLAMLQGSSLHDVFLEEFLQDGEQGIDALIDLMEIDLRDRIENSDPRDYKTNQPVDLLEIEACVEGLRTWGRGLLGTWKSGKTPQGEKFDVPNIIAVEIEKKPVEITLPKSNVTIRIRGFMDYITDEGVPGDLKLASDYYLAVWTLARAITEVQAVMYRILMGGPGPFEYLVVDKKQNRQKTAFAPTIRRIRFDVSERDIDRVIDTLDAFASQVDLANWRYDERERRIVAGENAFFPPIPEYNGETRADAGRTERNFCGKLCPFKEICFRENFAPDGYFDKE